MNAKLRFTLALPLISLWLTWGFFAVAQSVSPNFGENTQLNLTTYWFLGGLAVLAAGSTIAFRMAETQLAGGQAARGVLSFAGFSLIISSIAGAVYAFATFAQVFGLPAENRFLQAYLPIILVALIVVWSILQATVFRKAAVVRAEGEPRDPRRTALALAWSVPLLGSALALVIAAIAFGSSMNPTPWLGVWLFGIIAFSVILGTFFAAKARGLDAPTVEAKARRAATGAGRLNFVLAVVFGAVVTVFGFIWSLATISELTHYVDFYGQNLVVDNLIPPIIFMIFGTGVVYLTFLLRHSDEA